MTLTEAICIVYEGTKSYQTMLRIREPIKARKAESNWDIVKVGVDTN